jgi:hypothetical protein
MRSKHLRRVFLAVAVGCLAIGAALAANIALLGLASGPRDRVGQLQLRLDKRPAAQVSAPPPAPALVVTTPPLPQADDEIGPDD